MELRVFTVDAFTDHPFSGNPAAVVPLDEPLPEETLQKIAAEFNLSETAYLTPLSASSDATPDDKKLYWIKGRRFGLRWFTPINEVILCGHATLAASHTLYNCLGNTSDHLQFETLSGTLLARRNKASGTITLDFPGNCPTVLTDAEESQFGPLVNLVKAQLPVAEARISTSARKLLVRVADTCTREQLEAFEPDNRQLRVLHDGSVIKGLIVTLRGHLKSPQKASDDQGGLAKYDFVSRYFAEWNGIPEDPVTGSAHTVLGPYWAEDIGKTLLKCRQCSPRGGDLEVLVRGDGRVDITGKAVTVMRGTITV